MTTSACKTAAMILAIVASAAQASQIAYDDASDVAYADGWDAGDNGGIGFGPWKMGFSGDGGQLDPIYGGASHFIDGVDVGPLSENQLDAPSFGMTTSRRPFQADTVEAMRAFDEPLTTARSFQMVLDGSAYEIGQDTNIGNVFQLLGADGVPRYELTSVEVANNQWSSNGTNTALRYDVPVRFSFSMIGPDNFIASLQRLDDSIGFIQFNGALQGTPGMPIAAVRFASIGTGSSSDGATEMFFNNMQIVPEPPMGGLFGIWLLAVGSRRRCS